MPRRHSFETVNVLFVIVLLLELINFVCGFIPQFIRLILNELLFVLTPAVLYLRWNNLSFKETVGWRLPSLPVATGSLLLGIGLYPVSIVVTAILQNLLQYRILDTADLLPHTPFEGVLAIIAYAVMAPLCEEILARGIIQSAYHKHFTPAKAIFFSGLLFIVFHLSLLQGLGIIFLSLALGYVYWRSGTVVASMLTHFGANAMAALVVTSGIFWKEAPQVLLSPASIVLGLPLAIIGFTMLKRNTIPKGTQDEPGQEKVPVRFTLKTILPVVVIAIIYLAAVSSEFIALRHLERFLKPATVGAIHWESPTQLSYAVHNIAGDSVAWVTCDIQQEEDLVHFQWESTHQAYDIQMGNSRYVGSEMEITRKYTWRAADGWPLSGLDNYRVGQLTSTVQWDFSTDKFVISCEDYYAKVFEQEQPLMAGFEYPVLAGSAWPWVLEALPFEEGYAGLGYRFEPDTWRQATQDNGPTLEQVSIRISGPEELIIPAGKFSAWKVQVGDKETVWYAVDSPHIVLQYDTGFETIILHDLRSTDLAGRL